jgi:hypothetical protein
MITDQERQSWALHMLQQEWANINRNTFGRCLKPAVLNLHTGESKLGYWDRRHGTISLLSSLVMEQPWLKVVAVLKHEMLHQFIDEQMELGDTPPHGKLFQTLSKQFNIEEYEEVGLAPKGEGSTEEQQRSLILDKVQKLLSLAQSQEIHEAEAAMGRANALMLKWNLDQRDLDQKRQHAVRHLGRPGKVYLHLKMLACLLRDYFFVDVIWVQSLDPQRCRQGRVLEVIGRPENVDLAEYVYHFILNVGEQHWKNHRRNTGVGSRMNYLYGLICGFYDKCRLEREQSEQDRALIWSGEAWLDEVMRRRHPRVRSMSKSTARLDQGSYDAGRKQGQSLILRKGVKADKGKTGLNSGARLRIDKSASPST